MPKLNNYNWEMFCVLFMGKHRGNATQAYMEAYNAKAKKLSYLAVRQSASQLLTIPHIQKRCRELMDRSGLTAEKIDSKLLFLLDQMDDYKTSLGAAKEANAILGRTNKKQEDSPNVLTYEEHIHLHSHGQSEVQPALRGGQEELQQISKPVSQDQHKAVGHNPVQAEHSAGDIRGGSSEPSDKEETYTGFCS